MRFHPLINYYNTRASNFHWTHRFVEAAAVQFAASITVIGHALDVNSFFTLASLLENVRIDQIIHVARSLFHNLVLHFADCDPSASCAVSIEDVTVIAYLL
jgi:hypothetical protein